MYYYRRKANPIKWIIIIIILACLGGFGYWFYANYFSKIDFDKPEEEQVFQPEEEIEILTAAFDFIQGDIQISIDNQPYEKAAKSDILRQGHKIKTGRESLAVLNLENGAIIRLGADTEIILESLAKDIVSINQLRGRSCHYAAGQEKYFVESSKTKIAATDSRFEIITNAQQDYLAILAFENKINLEIFDAEGILMAIRLEAGEKALVDLKKNKNDLLKIEDFRRENLMREEWYRWNFELDQKIDEPIIDEPLPEEEPDFEAIKESLELAAEAKETGIFLSWSIYHKDDFKNYQIVRSENNRDVKYPDEKAIKSSASKELNSYLDAGAEKGKKYYYRICVLKINGKVACGNVEEIEMPREKEADTIQPSAPSLSAGISEAGVSLAWSANYEDDFKNYKILRAFNNSSLSYPLDSLAERGKGQENYLDNSVNITSPGNYYYQVCSFDLADNYACSNIIKVENGQLQ